MKTKKEVTEKVSAAVVLQAVQKEAAPIQKALEKLKIADAKSFDKAGVLVKQLKGLVKTAKEKESKIVDPINEALKEVKSLFKPFYANINDLEYLVKAEMQEFLTNQEAKTKKIGEKLESGEIKKVSTYHKKVSELQVTSSAVSQRSKTVLEITNPKLIPREYLIPDEKLIFEALKSGETIPGCKLKTEKVLAI